MYRRLPPHWAKSFAAVVLVLAIPRAWADEGGIGSGCRAR